jgi:hypothetical protein
MAISPQLGRKLEMDGQEVPTNQHILVDGHVHIHDCFNLQSLFDSARRNFCDAACELKIERPFSAVLLLTESYNVNYFSSLRRKATDKELVDTWCLQPTLESESLLVSHPEGFEIIIIAGRQIVTAERLEVLATCTDELFDDGGTISEVIASVSSANGIAIVPWGFGKWTGRRKKVIDRLISDFAKRPFHLGDNSGRISVWREPPQFGRAKLQGQRIFRGTDPLPFSGQEDRVGSFGFAINGPFDKSRPATSARNLLLSDSIRPTSYGALESPIAFTRHQLLIQMRKWRRKIRPTAT